MIVFITVLGGLKEHFPEKTEISVQEKTSLKAALADFAEKYHKKELLFDTDENISRRLVIQVNKKRISVSNASDLELKNNDEIVLYPPVSGG
ncbi:MAG: MoaD/ThiS family protein [Methanimicrococcus sp.]|nr:MoaD/ThiS family protein [Methanimicrococcus sp.]